MVSAVRLNVGCGQTPTEGWKNYDNSPSIRLAKRPIITKVLDKLGILNPHQKGFINFVKRHHIHWADVTRKIPEPDRSVEVIYSSHMLEHLDKEQAMNFLKEVRRVLILGGILRLAVPNIRYHVDNYLQHKDADKFIEATWMSRPRDKTLRGKLKYLWVGDRHHVWMYDGESLCKFLTAAGFQNAQVMPPGETMIKDPGELNLREREPESVFVEAVNP